MEAEKHLQPLFKLLKAQEMQDGALQSPCRAFTAFEDATLHTWSRPRHLIGKAEGLAQGENPRFIVTSLPADGRGEPALTALRRPRCTNSCTAHGGQGNRMKAQQLDLFADRTSTHWLASTPLRRWFSAFAHLILSTRQAVALAGTALERASIGQIRVRRFKIAARVRVSVRRIHLEWCSA